MVRCFLALVALIRNRQSSSFRILLRISTRSFIAERLKKARARESAGTESSLQPKQAPTPFILDHRVSTTSIYSKIAQDYHSNANAHRLTTTGVIPEIKHHSRENMNAFTPLHPSVTSDHLTDTVGTMITAGDQFSFRNEENHHKEALREEIRKHLTLLVKISSTSVNFISKSHPEQENDVLLQWKQWCDGQCLALARRHGVFVGPSLAGLVINDSLMRLLGTLTIIHMKQNGNGRTAPVLADRSHALADAEWLSCQYTRELQARAGQLIPLTPVLPLTSTSPPTSSIFNAPEDRHGDKNGVQSNAATTAKLTEESTDGQLSGHPAPPPPAPISTAPATLVLRQHRRSGSPHVGRACASCRKAKRGCDRARPACGTCVRTLNSCGYE